MKRERGSRGEKGAAWSPGAAHHHLTHCLGRVGGSGYHRGMSVPWPLTPSRTKGTVACLAEALLWVGGSVAVSPQWQLGPLGKGAGLSGWSSGVGTGLLLPARALPSTRVTGVRRVGPLLRV